MADRVKEEREDLLCWGEANEEGERDVEVSKCLFQYYLLGEIRRRDESVADEEAEEMAKELRISLD